MRIKIDPLDILFSRYIRTRANWTCERCFRKFVPPTASLQCSHFHGRRKKLVRWDPENAAALCFQCHRICTEQPMIHVEWFKVRLGIKRFNSLLLRANTVQKPDKELIRIWLKKELEYLENHETG